MWQKRKLRERYPCLECEMHGSDLVWCSAIACLAILLAATFAGLWLFAESRALAMERSIPSLAISEQHCVTVDLAEWKYLCLQNHAPARDTSRGKKPGGS